MKHLQYRFLSVPAGGSGYGCIYLYCISLTWPKVPKSSNIGTDSDSDTLSAFLSCPLYNKHTLSILWTHLSQLNPFTTLVFFIFLLNKLKFHDASHGSMPI